MPTLALQLQADFGQVTGLVPADGVEAALLLPIECTSCHEAHPNPVALEPSNLTDLQKSRGTANLVVHCPSCRRENSATFVVRQPGSRGDAPLGEASPWTPAAPDADHTTGWHTLCTVDFRGMNPLDTSIDALLSDSSSWTCTGTESGTPFTDMQFDDGEWHDYDDKAGDEVSITEVQLRWQKV